MAELLLGEMMREWRFGSGGEAGTEAEEEMKRLNHSRRGIVGEDNEEEEEIDGGEKIMEQSNKKRKRGNERVKPDVVTFTAV